MVGSIVSSVTSVLKSQSVNVLLYDVYTLGSTYLLTYLLTSLLPSFLLQTDTHTHTYKKTLQVVSNVFLYTTLSAFPKKSLRL